MNVRILFDDPEALINYHHGLTPTAFADRDARYEPNAIVSGLPRRPIDSAALVRCRATEATPDTALLELVRPPEALAALARELTSGTAPVRYARVRVDVPEVGGTAHDVTLHAVTTSPPDTPTVTINSSTVTRFQGKPTGRLLGIHVDNDDALHRSNRLAGSRRRLVINLGPGPRYLLIAEPGVLHISRTMYRTNERHVPTTSDVRAFARRYPDALTIHWLLLEPGEGYVAATQLFPHDGSTLGINQPSDIAVYHGRWPRRFFPSLLT